MFGENQESSPESADEALPKGRAPCSVSFLKRRAGQSLVDPGQEEPEEEAADALKEAMGLGGKGGAGGSKPAKGKGRGRGRGSGRGKGKAKKGNGKGKTPNEQPLKKPAASQRAEEADKDELMEASPEPVALREAPKRRHRSLSSSSETGRSRTPPRLDPVPPEGIEIVGASHSSPRKRSSPRDLSPRQFRARLLLPKLGQLPRSRRQLPAQLPALERGLRCSRQANCAWTGTKSSSWDGSPTSGRCGRLPFGP